MDNFQPDTALHPADGAWRPWQLASGKWIVAREIRKASNVHREVCSEAGAFVRFDTEAMANLMAGKMNR